MVPNHRATRRQIRRVGLIGGMSWRSTALYYARLNKALEAALGPHHSFKGDVVNLDYAALLAMAGAADWRGIEDMLAGAAQRLVKSDCDVIALTAVTAHRWYEPLRLASPAVMPHVLTAAAHQLDILGIPTAGVLGTGMTCGSEFTRAYLGYGGRNLLFLEEGPQAEIDEVIQSVLTASDTILAGRAVLNKAVLHLQARGAEAVVLACTELPLLLPLDKPDIPLLDCVALHVDDICNHILGDSHA